MHFPAAPNFSQPNPPGMFRLPGVKSIGWQAAELPTDPSREGMSGKSLARHRPGTRARGSRERVATLGSRSGTRCPIVDPDDAEEERRPARARAHLDAGGPGRDRTARPDEPVRRAGRRNVDRPIRGSERDRGSSVRRDAVRDSGMDIGVSSVRRVPVDPLGDDASTRQGGEVRRVLRPSTLSECIPAIDREADREDDHRRRQRE